MSKGPWIHHDGKGFPRDIFEREKQRGATGFVKGLLTPGRLTTPLEEANPGKGVDPNHPGWKWKRKYLFFGPLVASDPAYARIVRYRFTYPYGEQQETSEQLEILKAIAKGVRQSAEESA